MWHLKYGFQKYQFQYKLLTKHRTWFSVCNSGINNINYYKQHNNYYEQYNFFFNFYS